MKIKPGLSTKNMLPRYKGHTHKFWHREERTVDNYGERGVTLRGYRFICECGAEIVDDLSQPFLNKDALIKKYLESVGR